jgi:hypothetical protein
MSNLALMEVQRALYNKLNGDGVLMGMISGIYDVVPQKTIFPYIVIGDGNCSDIATDILNISDLRLGIEIWSGTSGRKAALTIMNRLFAMLHLGTLTLSGYQLVLLRCEQSDTQLTEEATYIRGTMVVRATVVEE